jgi:hypothetical protein
MDFNDTESDGGWSTCNTFCLNFIQEIERAAILKGRNQVLSEIGSDLNSQYLNLTRTM